MILGLLTYKTHSPDPFFHKYEKKTPKNLDRFVPQLLEFQIKSALMES